jgi:hypothetical protein
MVDEGPSGGLPGGSPHGFGEFVALSPVLVELESFNEDDIKTVFNILSDASLDLSVDEIKKQRASKTKPKNPPYSIKKFIK